MVGAAVCCVSVAGGWWVLLSVVSLWLVVWWWVLLSVVSLWLVVWWWVLLSVVSLCIWWLVGAAV